MLKKEYASPKIQTCIFVTSTDILLGSEVLIDSSGLFDDDETSEQK